MCIDYRRLNAVTEAVHANLPAIDDILASLPPKINKLSKIDLKRALNQLRLVPESESLST
jgi:hypothetical protein